MIKQTRIKVTTVGSAGSATGTTDSEDVINGRILRVDVDYHASAPGTTDVILSEVEAHVAHNVISKTDNATDFTAYPSIQLTDSAGAGRTFDGTRAVVVPDFVSGHLRLTVNQCDALTNAVVADIYYEECRG